jgi:two-component sensor histidine kinase
MRPSPRVSSDRRGRLYFATLDSVAIVDPSAVTQSSPSLPIVLESVTIDNRAIDLTTTEPFVEPSRLQFDYTSLSLRSPENARFRYQLEGYDKDWVEAGGQRHVTYGTLRPGSYRFRVIGAGSEGVWNEAGASFAFQINPVFWRTWWFLLTLMALGLGLVAGLYRLRVHQLTRQFDLGMEARISEQTRIAQELHDGIMQQISALSLMLGTARRKIKLDVEAKAEIKDVQKRLIQVGTELRQLSHDMHPASLEDGGLPDSLRAYCSEFGRVRGVSVSCDADDAVCELSRGAALALYRIAQEAMGNAVKHGAAERVDLRLTRSNARVTLSVTDDGKGFDPNRIGGSGGLGLINMRERARQLKGTFELSSEPGRETTVRVTIPFR